MGAAPVIACVVSDDHQEMLAVTVAALEDAGYVVVGTASTGAEAVSAIAQLQPLVAVVDYQLPDMTGIEVAAEVQRLSPATRIVLHSARLDAEVAAEAFAAGVGGVVVKGSVNRLLDALTTVAGGATYVDPTVPPRLDS